MDSDVSDATFTAAFTLFPALPKELRDGIWLATLAPELPPRALLFTLVIQRDPVPLFNTPGPLRAVVLLPGIDPSYRVDTALLARSTAVARTLELTCREARAAVHRALPDRLPFGLAYPKDDPAQNHQYFLRFHGQRDIVVMKVNIGTEQHVANWFQENWTGADAFPPFAPIRNLGIDAAELSNYGPRRPMPVEDHCYCGEGSCSTCGQDPLPRFLKGFSNLKTFYVAAASEFYPISFTKTHRIRRVSMGRRMSDEAGAGNTARHDISLVRATDEISDWFVSYKDGEGDFPPLLPLDRIRANRLPGWPCRFQGLRHLEFRILRRLKSTTPAAAMPPLR